METGRDLGGGWSARFKDSDNDSEGKATGGRYMTDRLLLALGLLPTSSGVTSIGGPSSVDIDTRGGSSSCCWSIIEGSGEEANAEADAIEFLGDEAKCEP